MQLNTGSKAVDVDRGGGGFEEEPLEGAKLNLREAESGGGPMKSPQSSSSLSAASGGGGGGGCEVVKVPLAVKLELKRDPPWERDGDAKKSRHMVTLVVATTADPASNGPVAALFVMPGWQPGPPIQVPKTLVSSRLCKRSILWNFKPLLIQIWGNS